jgi:hypothetical protein
MRAIVAVIVGPTALAATAIQAASMPSKVHSSGGSHEAPAENVRKSQYYDHFLRTMVAFCAAARTRNAGRSSVTAICTTIASGRSIFMSRSGRV